MPDETFGQQPPINVMVNRNAYLLSLFRPKPPAKSMMISSRSSIIPPLEYFSSSPNNIGIGIALGLNLLVFRIRTKSSGVPSHHSCCTAIQQQMSRVRRKSKGTTTPSKRAKASIDLGWTRDDDENIESSDSEGEGNNLEPSLKDEDSVEEEETLDAKKVRLARQYLENLEADSNESSSSSDGSSSGSDDEDGDETAYHDRISRKLQKERLKRQGAFEQPVADTVHRHLDEFWQHTGLRAEASSKEQRDAWLSSGRMRLMRGHDLTPTCIALQSDGSHAVSGSKDHSVIFWDIEKEQKVNKICEHWRADKEADRNGGEVLCVACSDDGRYVATGKNDGSVCIFDVRERGKSEIVKTFVGHKKRVTALAFRANALQLFSGSEDRCIRHYNLNEMMYLETLYGHQFGVTGIGCFRKERPISVGRDRTARAWKLSEDSHLIFRSGAKILSPDCVTLVKDDWFLTGHEDGHIGLWMTEKKRAVKMVSFAHGISNEALNVGNGIASIASLPGSDIAATGSCDGYIRLWKVSTGIKSDERDLVPLDAVPANGYVNGLALGPKARFCVAALGQEPRLGRWNRIQSAKNRVAVVLLKDKSSDEEDGGDYRQNLEDASADDDSDARPTDQGNNSDDHE